MRSSVTASAAVVGFDSGPLNQWLPDDSATGFASTISVADSGIVAGVSVRFALSVPANQTGWLGDLYAYLRHDDGFAVLLNRPGRTSVSPFGYGDSQSMNLTFADGALNGDIHRYRGAAPLNSSGSLVGPLLGAWAPDGRAADPAVVPDTTPRTALLGGFAGHSLSGNWTLFVADLSSGGQHRLDRWALEFEIQPTAVPEPATSAAAVTIGLLAFACWRGRRPRLTPASTHPRRQPPSFPEP
jgi:subtilisin-like proprotein convertase family protein